MLASAASLCRQHKPPVVALGRVCLLNVFVGQGQGVVICRVAKGRVLTKGSY